MWIGFTMNNLYNKFQSLTPTSITTVVTITSKNGDGTSTATTLAGTAVIVVGESVDVGKKAYVKNGEITRQAPSLTITVMPI